MITTRGMGPSRLLASFGLGAFLIQVIVSAVIQHGPFRAIGSSGITIARRRGLGA